MMMGRTGCVCTLLVAFLAMIVATSCGSRRHMEMREVVAERGVSLSVDTSRLQYVIEVYNEFSRDTLVRSLYREQGERTEGRSHYRDTLYIHTRDTVYISQSLPSEGGTGKPLIKWWHWLAMGAVLPYLLRALLRVACAGFPFLRVLTSGLVRTKPGNRMNT